MFDLQKWQLSTVQSNIDGVSTMYKSHKDIIFNVLRLQNDNENNGATQWNPYNFTEVK